MDAKEKWTVISLAVQYYEGNRSKTLETEYPTFKDVTEAVRSLNGGSKSTLCISGGNGSILTIGGGLGNYHVQANVDNRVFLLRDATKPEEEVSIIIGSVDTSLPANLIVDEQMTMASVQEYFSHGTLACNLDWVES